MEAVRATAKGVIPIKAKKTKAYGTKAAEAPLEQLNIQRRKPTPHDVEIEILYCGVCHSDLHTARMSGMVQFIPVCQAMRSLVKL